MVKIAQTIRQQQPPNFLNVFERFVELAFKSLKFSKMSKILSQF